MRRPQRTWLWSDDPDRSNWTEHISSDWEAGAPRSIDVVESDDAVRVILFGADDAPLVTEPWQRKMGFKR